MSEVKVKIIAVFSILFNYLGWLVVPILCLPVLNTFDIITALGAAKYRAAPEDERPVKSSKFKIGIYKKVAMYIPIIVGYMMDIMVNTALRQLGFTFPLNIFAISIACWQCLNETISIVENLDDGGVDVPPFLLPVLRKMRTNVNEKVEKETKIGFEVQKQQEDDTDD